MNREELKVKICDVVGNHISMEKKDELTNLATEYAKAAVERVELNKLKPEEACSPEQRHFRVGVNTSIDDLQQAKQKVIKELEEG